MATNLKGKLQTKLMIKVHRSEVTHVIKSLLHMRAAVIAQDICHFWVLA